MLLTGACRPGLGCTSPPRRRRGLGGTSRTGPPWPEQRGSGTQAGCLRGCPHQHPPKFPHLVPCRAAMVTNPMQPCRALSHLGLSRCVPPLLTHTPGLPIALSRESTHNLLPGAPCPSPQSAPSTVHFTSRDDQLFALTCLRVFAQPFPEHLPPFPNLFIPQSPSSHADST